MKIKNELSLETRATVWYTISSLLQKCASFILIPIYTRIMTKEEYGIYTLFQSWLLIISILATLNLSLGAFNKGLIKFENKSDDFVSSMFGLSVCTTLLFAVIVCLGQKYWIRITGLNAIVTFCIILDCLFNPAYLFWCTKKRFEYKYKNVVMLSVLLSIGMPVLSLPIIMLSSGNKGIYTIASREFLSVFCYLVPVILILSKSRRVYSKFFWKYALRFNLPLIPHFLSTIILQQSDRIMIGKLIGADKAAIYGLAFNISMIMQFMNGAILNSITPWVYKNLKEGITGTLNHTIEKVIVFVGTLNFLIILIAPEVIAIMAPPEYSEANHIIVPLALSCFLIFIINTYTDIEYYYEATTGMTLSSITLAILNIVLNYLCIRQWGYQAAAYVTLGGYLLYTFEHYYLMKRACLVSNSKTIYSLKKVKWFILLLIISSFLFSNIFSSILIRYLVVLLIVCILIKKRKEILHIL